MKSDFGKRGFLLLMVLLFGAICLLSMKDRAADAVQHAERQLENKSLFLERREGDVIYIGGEGALSQEDLRALMKAAEVRSNELVNVIIGNDITEIGYNVLNGLSNLETLRLGDNTRTVNNGSIKNCGGLRYIYIPGGIQRLGLDFLFECSGVFILTDGEGQSLPEMPNVIDNQIISGVHGFDDLAMRMVDDSRAVYDWTQLYTNDPAPVLGESMLIHRGYLQYGPYVPMAHGLYMVQIEGTGFERLGYGDFDVSADDVVIEAGAVRVSADGASYLFKLEKDSERVEFRTFNYNGNDLEIRRITVGDAFMEAPEVLRQWWQ